MYSRPQLKEFAEKTVRWPGHWQGVHALKEIGMLDIDPKDFQGKKIVPREFLLHLIVPKLKPGPGETDVCIMYNTLNGIKDGKKVRIEYFMWDEADTVNGISSMMRATGYPVAVATKMMLAGEINGKGIVPPEDAITSELYPKFIEEMKKRNIDILEEITYL